MKRLLSINPEKRIKLPEIKAHPFYQMGFTQWKKREFVIDHKMLSNKTIEKLLKLGYNLSDIKTTLKNNETNPISTSYNLLFNKVKSITFKKNLQSINKDSKIQTKLSFTRERIGKVSK
jgi:hypothetical protein